MKVGFLILFKLSFRTSLGSVPVGLGKDLSQFGVEGIGTILDLLKDCSLSILRAVEGDELDDLRIRVTEYTEVLILLFMFIVISYFFCWDYHFFFNRLKDVFSCWSFFKNVTLKTIYVSMLVWGVQICNCMPGWSQFACWFKIYITTSFRWNLLF